MADGVIDFGSEAPAASVADRRGVHRFDDFIIYNEPGQGDKLRLLARGLAHRIRSSVQPPKPAARA